MNRSCFPECVPSPPPLLFLVCFSLGCLFSGWAGLLSSPHQSICTPDSHRWTINPPAFRFKSLVFSSILANSLVNPPWCSLPSKCSAIHVGFGFLFQATHCLFCRSTSQRPARPPAQRDLVSPPRVVCRLLIAEPSVKILVDCLWLVCLCLLGFSLCCCCS